MSDTPVSQPVAQKPVSKPVAMARNFDAIVAETASDLSVENPRSNHEINLGLVHSIVQRTQTDLAHAASHVNESNADKYLEHLQAKTVGLIFAAKTQAKLVIDFCKSHNLDVPPLIASIDAIKTK